MGFIRLSLALAVLLGHMGTGLPITSATQAVAVFFVISGYYMSLTFSANYDRSPGGLISFYASRFFRLYPMYLFIVVLAWAIFKLVPISQLNAFGAFNYFIHPHTWPEHIAAWSLLGQDLISVSEYKHAILPVRQAWSISAELAFYLLLPFLLVLKTRMLVTALALSFALKSALLYVFGFQFAYFPFPCQIGYFIMGILAFRFRDQLTSKSRLIGVSVFLVTIASVFSYIPSFEVWPIPSTVQCAGAALAIPTIMAFVVSRADRLAGDLSYGFYMSHLLIFDIVKSSMPTASSWETVPIVVTCSLLLSFLFERFVQEPIDAWRRRTFYQRPRSATDSGAVVLAAASAV